MDNSERTIRASMLPGYADCPRRAAAKQYRQVITDAGHELRTLLPSVGAAVGTAVHKVAEHVLRAKIAGQEPADVFDAALAAGVAAFTEEIGPGAEWDDTTPNLQVATVQIHRVAAAYLPVVHAVTPAAVELELRAGVGDGWELTGHVDRLDADGHLDDLKTGAVRRPYQAQLGGYALLAKASGHQVNSVGITFVPRGKKTKPQPPAECQTYDLETSERAAWSTIQAIKRDVAAFRSSGDPYAFPANPMSLMCSARYCPAWGTSFCSLHLKDAANHAVD